MPRLKDWFLGLTKAGQAAIIGGAVVVSGFTGSAMMTPSTPPQDTPATQAAKEAPKKPVTTQKTETETVEIPFDETTKDDPALPRGETKITQAGVVGVKEITYTITLVDGKETDRQTSEKVTAPPVAQVTAVGSSVAPAPAPTRTVPSGSTPTQQSGGVVKLSKNGICHAPGTTYYSQTKRFTGYGSLQDCLNAGGRMPKR